MMKKFIFFLCLSAGISAQAQTDTYLSTDFQKGIPSDFTLKDYDENPVTNSDFKAGRVNESWSVYTVDSEDNKAALSTSRGEKDSPVNNWMITPSVKIDSENAWLTWDAKSVHYDLRDGYKVMVSTTDISPESFTEVYSIEAEDYFWAHHFVSLKAYQGKNIYVAFVNNSQSKYIIAIDNLFIGIPASGEFEILDETLRFVGSDSNVTSVKGKLRNLGGTVKLKQLDCKSNDEVFRQQYNDAKMQPGETVDFEFEIPVTEGKTSVYTLNITTDAHTDKEIYKDSVMCSRFPRILVVEEYTGSWCNTCPRGSLYMSLLKKRYKDQIITIVGHCRDEMTDSVYSTNLDRWIFEIPSFMYDRTKSTIYSPEWNNKFEDKKIAEYITKSVDAKAELTADYEDKDHTVIKTQARATFASELDNSTNRYKLGYAIIEKTVTGYKQANSLSGASAKEYNFLPAIISENLMIFHDVPRGTDNSFAGIENSLPSTIEENQEYTYDYKIEIPASVANKNNISVVVFILDTKAGTILNAKEVKNPTPHPSSINEETVNGLKISTYQSVDKQNIIIELPNEMNGELSYIKLSGLDGKTIYASQSKTNGSVTIPVNGHKGCYIITLSAKNKTISKKIMLF